MTFELTLANVCTDASITASTKKEKTKAVEEGGTKLSKTQWSRSEWKEKEKEGKQKRETRHSIEEEQEDQRMGWEGVPICVRKG